MTGIPFYSQHFEPPTGPVLLSVPHAGRAYDAAILRNLRVPIAATLPLEDRYVDRLTDLAVAAGVPTIIANTPRLTIDLNRAPDDIDYGSAPYAVGHPVSAKARAGLGLVPTRLWGVGALWQALPDPSAIAARVATIHAPYHGAIAKALLQTRQRFGAAILIDLHSMPPIAGSHPPDIVIGDRFGASAGTQITACAEAALRAMGFRVAINAPYAGGYVVTRHAAPHAGIHALQIEIDRRLYLDAALDQPSAALHAIQNAVVMLVSALAQDLPDQLCAAAE